MSKSRQFSMMHTNLKRNKRSYESTALQTMQQTRTIPKQFYKENYSDPVKHPTIKPAFLLLKQHQDIQQYKKQVRPMIEKIATNISIEQSKHKREVNSKSMRHFYYRGISRTINHPLIRTPKIVFQLSERANIRRKKASSPLVSYTYGFLQQVNCVYYSIQNKIVFVRAQDLFNHQDASDSVEIPYVIYEVRGQVISVFQIVGSNAMFPHHDLIIAVVHPWEIQFYAWQPVNVLKKQYVEQQVYKSSAQTKQFGLKSLNFIYGLPMQRLEHIDFGSNGKLFFFDEEGALHQITPHEEKLFLIYKTGKYSIRSYVNNSLNTFQILNKKHGKFAPLFNLASNLSQASKYLFPSKITTKKIFCDRRKQLLFGLLQRKIQLPFSHENQIFIVCYDIKQKAKLIHKFSQNYFIQRYGSHIHSQRANQFRIQSIYPAPEFYQCANISIISKSGIKIIMQIIPNDAKIIEIIRPPDQRMFETELSTLTNQCHYPPKQKSPYQVQSYLEDQEKTIYTVTRQKGILHTFITASSILSGTIDISQQANNINLEIFKEGSWKLKIYKINERKMLTYLNQNINGQVSYTSQLSSQTLLPPVFYLFQGPLKMQLMSYVRPIDLLFTALSVMNMQSHTFRNLIEKNMSKQKLLMKIFLSESFSFSLIGNFQVSIQELCSMILQIIIDKDGLYFYSSQAAGQIARIWQSYKKDQNKIKQNISNGDHLRNFNQIQNYNRFNNVIRTYTSHFRIGTNQICPYKKISQKLLSQAKQTFQELAFYGPDLHRKFLDRFVKANNNSQIFLDFPEVPFALQNSATFQRATKQKIIQFKINALVNYLSRMLLHIWETNISEITQPSRLFLLSKLQYFYSYLNKSQSSLKIFSATNIPQVNYVNKQYGQLASTVSRAIQLLLLIDNIPILPQKKKFGYCLSEKQDLFQESMFKAIHREFRSYIINKWKNLFPAFVSDQFVKLIRLYGEIQQMTSKENIANQLEIQSIIFNYPPYFLNYLSKSRQFTDQQIEQIRKNSQKTRKITNNQNMFGDDFEFQMPTKLIQIVNSYNKTSEKLSQSDLQYIKILLTTKNQKQRLTITNKQSIITYIKTNLPKNDQIQNLAKYISVQYQLYRYYLNQISKLDKQNKDIKWRIFNSLCNKNNNQYMSLQQNNVKCNALTMQLLRFQTIIDCDQKDDKLKKLVITTANYWLMLDYYTIFQDFDNLQNILKNICNDFSSNSNKKYSSFSTYIQRYLLNIALKSSHSSRILSIICTTIDEYLLQNEPVAKNAMMNWMSFNSSISYISDDVIWLPQLLIKLGYDPKKLFHIYISQMQDSFDRFLPFETQVRYGFKILNCFMLTDKYVKNQRKEFAKILSLQLDLYEENQKTKNKNIIGVRKMLDQLISKPV